MTGIEHERPPPMRRTMLMAKGGAARFFGFQSGNGDGKPPGHATMKIRPATPMSFLDCEDLLELPLEKT